MPSGMEWVKRAEKVRTDVLFKQHGDASRVETLELAEVVYLSIYNNPLRGSVSPLCIMILT
jgi:hypothetical protein